MIAFSPIMLALLLLANVLIGMAIGAVSGRITAAIVGKDWRDLFRLSRICTNAIFGGAAYVVFLLVVVSLPWPRNTIAYDIGQTHVTSTANHFQYPNAIAYLAAIALPALYEFYRFRRSQVS